MLIEGFSQEQSYSQIENWMIYLFFCFCFSWKNVQMLHAPINILHMNMITSSRLLTSYIHEPYTYVHVLSYIGSLLNRCIWLLAVHTIK